jgi:hypothetical protein
MSSPLPRASTASFTQLATFEGPWPTADRRAVAEAIEAAEARSHRSTLPVPVWSCLYLAVGTETWFLAQRAHTPGPIRTRTVASLVQRIAEEGAARSPDAPAASAVHDVTGGICPIAVLRSQPSASMMADRSARRENGFPT